VNRNQVNLAPLHHRLAAVQDHARQFADFTLVYPVISRRAGGLSIGVNLNPDKLCNFDCIYCEVDRRTPAKPVRVDPNQIREELTSMIRWAKSGLLGQQPKFAEVAALTGQVKDIALSGEGEPTMIANFAECVEVVISVRAAEQLDQTKIVLITNAVGLGKANVKRGLELIDAHRGEIWGKLDAGTALYFRRVNRTRVRFERILKNLAETARVRPIVIQSLFLKIAGEPMPPAELRAYCDRLNEMVETGRA